MGLFDRLFGREEEQPRNRSIPAPPPGQGYNAAQGYGDAPSARRSEDEIAVERYRYLLRTAPPETIEQVHEEAFGKLTPEQRRMVFQQLSANAPAGEQPRGDDPRSLAQAATRSELRRPGTLENSFGSMGGRGGPGFGSMLGASLLGTVAGYVVASALVGAMFGGYGDEGSADAGADSGAEGGDPGAGTDAGSADVAGGDGGSDWGGFGGGDFGGGDFGGF
ncbi:hypothetical protein ACFFGH_11045 [Lysobacter korlensis]|uniref:DUF2076 domain-containing protein n=1 Tax=Lysobacter korlensis TaxID=553636 RepID=A0ABV6RNJ6_9GAMM